MSHFSVMVIGQNVDEQLSSYYETSDYSDEDYRSILKFKDGEEYRKEYEEGTFHYGTDKGKRFKEVYATLEEYLKDYVVLSIDPHTEKYGYWYNPNAKWDWYVVGGRWSNYFRLKEGLEKNYADFAQKRDIDFEGMLEDKATEALERYTLLEKLLGEIPKLTYTWDDFTAKGGAFSNLDIQEKRKIYWDQEAFKRVASAALRDDFTQEQKDFLMWLNLEDYQKSKEEYVSYWRKRAFTPFALVKDGKWYERGEMGWWGIVSNEKEQDVWDEEFFKLIEDLDEKTYFTIVDCHI